MKITSKIDSEVFETEVLIIAKSKHDIDNITRAVESVEKEIIGEKDGKIYRLKFSDILYFESVDKKTFAYAQKDVYEISKKLYGIEEIMPNEFFRCEKATIINLSRVVNFESVFGAKLIAKLENGEKIGISRFYVKELKIKLNGGKVK